MIKIFNRILWGIKPPENRSDIWFDGEVFKIYRKGEWEAITIEIDAAAKLADIIKGIDNVYQTKLVEGEGILLEDSKISVKRMFQVVNELPKTGEYNTIYLLVKNNKESGSYTYFNNKWINISSSITVDNYLSTTSTNPVENKIITKKIETLDNTIHNLDVVRIVDSGVTALDSGNYKDGSVGSALSSSDKYTEVALTGDHIGYNIQGVQWIHDGGMIIIPSFMSNTSCAILLEDKNGNSGSIVMEVKSGLKVFLYIKTPSSTTHLIQDNTIILAPNINNTLTRLLRNYKIIALNSNGFGIEAFSHYFKFDLAKDNRELYFKNGNWEKVITENNIKTINGESVLGSGDIHIEGGGDFDDTELRQSISELYDLVSETVKINDLSYLLEDKADKSDFSALSNEVCQLSERIDNIPQGASMTPLTYEELKYLRDNGKLVAGTYYRITNYITTTAQENTQSAGHPFDVIVLALSENTLAEEAYAIQSARDTDGYFANSNLAAWKLWYSIDNDTERFAWADAENGKGVIYRMIDELNNDIPYDFKNIQFKHPKDDTTYPDYYYTFSWIDDKYEVIDTSVFGNNGTLTYYGEIRGVCGNVIKSYMKTIYDEDSGESLGTKQSLNNIIFVSDCELEYSGNEGFYGCNFNTFENNCYNNTFGNYCNNNIFGNSCYNNDFASYCYSNSFGNVCYSNTFGYNCNNNSFGDSCNNNTLKADCYNNTFGNYCNNNSFEQYCRYNTFGNYYCSNTFGSNCNNNTFGNRCGFNSFRSSASASSSLKNYCYYNHFDDGCSYNVVWNSSTTSSSVSLKNINVNRGVSGTSSNYNFIDIDTLNADYEIQVAKNLKGEIKIYCEADLIA